MAERTTTFEAAAFTQQGATRDKVELPQPLFDGTVNTDVMHQAVKAYLANQRQGNASTKTRGLVVGGNQAVVEGDEDGADLGDAVVALHEVMRVGAEDADAVARLDAEGEERVPELVDALLELAVGEAVRAIDDSRLVRIELGRAAQEIVDEQRYFHGGLRRRCGRHSNAGGQPGQ